MFFHVAAVARDWAIILLALEGMVLALVPFFLLWKGTQQVRRFLPRVRPGLRLFHGRIVRVANGVERVLAAVRAPFIWVQQAEASVRTFWQSLRGE